MCESVTRLTSPKPTVTSLMPAAFAAPAAAIAVLSFPPTVCTPSDSSTSTFGTPARAPAPSTTDCPSSMPPERNVPPPIAGALSSFARIVGNDAVSPECVTVVVSNST
eukprot:2296008-Prymnesium_polylepis.3